MDYLSELRAAIKHNTGCDSAYLYGTPVNEFFNGQPAWQGQVEVFAIYGHSRAQKCYAWGYPNPQRGGKYDYLTVLEIPPVTSAQSAVKAVIAATAKGQIGGV